MSFFDWLNKAFEDDEPKTTKEQTTTAAVDAPKKVVVVKPTPKLYTAEDVHRDLAAFVLLFLADIQQEIERKEAPATIAQDAALLSEFGLTQSKNAVIANRLKKEVDSHNKEYNRKKATLAFMADVWEKFGNDAMVVRYDHFFQILEKYDMVCGSFDRYTGGIPQEALSVLSSLKELWSKGLFNQEHGLPLSYAKRFTFRDEHCDLVHLRNRMRMPMRVSNQTVMQKISNLCFTKDLGVDNPRGLNSINDALFIAAPAADMQPLEIRVEFETDKLEELRSERPPSPNWSRLSYRRLASEEESYVAKWRDFNKKIEAEEERLQSIIEKSNIARYCKFDFIKTQPLPERGLYDPFICSLTPHGVLIHAKWGPEAEDATIKRYEQLRDAIIGNSKSLTV